MVLLWHGLVPLVTAVVGYFPGRALRIGEDLPRGVVEDWTSVRYKRSARRERRADQPLPGEFANFDRLHAPVLALSFTDDVFATEPAVERHLALLRATAVEHRRRSPAELAVRKVGHFGFFRPTFRDSLWAEAADWLAPAGP